VKEKCSNKFSNNRTPRFDMSDTKPIIQHDPDNILLNYKQKVTERFFNRVGKLHSLRNTVYAY